MAIRDWHFGKLLILWTGALALVFIGSGRYDDTLGWGIAGLVVASIISWRWLSRSR